MTTPAPALLRRSAEASRPDPLMLVSEWADARLILPDTAPEPGQWHKERTPYIIEPMDRLSRQDPCELLVVMMASQTGKTQCILLAAMGHHIDTSPRPMLYVQPTIETAEEHAKERVQPMLADCPTLAARVPSSKARDGGNTLKLKKFPGGFVKFAGANSAASLASTPIGDAFCDEIDRWPEDCDGEGDPVALVKARLTNFRNAKLVLTSTPTETDHSRIETALLTTDQNERWVPCPHCGEFQILHWRTREGPMAGTYRVTWPKGEPHRAVYVCEHNGCVIEEREKAGMDARGEWRATCPEKSLGGKRRGYRLAGLLSPWFGWGKLAAEWDDCHGDPVKLRTFINTRLAETFDSNIGGTVKAEGLLGRREPYTTAPAGVVVVTAAVDCQGDRLELHLTGWGADFESWALDHVIIPGSPAENAPWAAVDAHRARRIVTADGRGLVVAALCIDAGDGNFSDRVIQFCAPRHSDHVWAIKGSSNPASPIWPKKPSKITKVKARKAAGLPLYVVGVSQCKTEIMARLGRDGSRSPGPGAMHFPERWPTSQLECDQSYFEQLTAEKRVMERNRRVWKKRSEGARNESLDLWCYSYAALHGLMRLGVKLPRWVPPAAPDKAPREVPAEAAPVPVVPLPPRPVVRAPVRKSARRAVERPRSLW